MTTMERKFRFSRLAMIVLGAATAAAGCIAESEALSSDSDEGALTGTDAALSAQDKALLASKGFAPDEINAVAESIVISKVLGLQSLVKEANDGEAARDSSVRRESHGKSQGCLRAKFDVTATSGAGVFARGASYPAWIRLSNGGAYQKDDKSRHISRGWGIKLMGVEASSSGTQDFLFITSPRFFISDIRHYPGFLRSSGNGRLATFWNLLTNMSGEERDVIKHRLGLKVSNLLESPEYSAVPYAYGRETVKYAVAPCAAGAPPSTPSSRPPASNASEDYLEEAMNATLASSPPEGLCFAFFVQRPRAGGLDSIENPTKAWEGAFEPVAKITIPAGQHEGGPASYRANDAACEQMAFDPFHTTTANMPVGKTNWTRKFVYAALAEFRRVEVPKIYARWKLDHDDASIPVEFRRELAKLRDPSSLAPTVRDTAEPTVDGKFRELGIVR